MKLKLFAFTLSALGLFLFTECKSRTGTTAVDRGCAEGRSWSNMAERCVKREAVGIDMYKPKSNGSKPACYVYMVDSLTSAEIFLPKLSEGIVLTAEKSYWVHPNKEYKLILNSQSYYELYNAKNKLIYSSR